MTKNGLFKDERDTLQRRVRHRDGKLLRGGIGLTTGLGWSDSEDEEDGSAADAEEEEDDEDEEEEDEDEEDEESEVETEDDDLRIYPKPKTVISDITGQPKRVYPEIEADYDSDSSTEDVWL